MMQAAENELGNNPTALRWIQRRTYRPESMGLTIPKAPGRDNCRGFVVVWGRQIRGVGGPRAHRAVSVVTVNSRGGLTC